MGKDPDKPYPMSIVASESGFHSLIELISHVPKVEIMFRNTSLNHHESFNYQGVKFLIHNPFELFSKRSASHTTIANSSMFVFMNPQKTIIDEVLESYEPKRFEIGLKFLKVP
jgi:hypothetical protein